MWYYLCLVYSINLEKSCSRCPGTMNRMVNSMNTINNSNEINIIRTIFIETLNDEFTSKTGVGVYVYLAPMDINQLFKDYLHQNKTIRFFAQRCVKNTLP